MSTSGKSGPWLDRGWLLLWGTLSSLWCLTSAQQLSATFDEPIYVTRGLEAWRSGSHAGLIKLGTMPLPVDVQTLPLYLYERWTGVKLDPEQQMSQLLPWARAMNLGFWWLLLFYAGKTGRLIGGVWGGRLAILLLAIEPGLLAHASLATTDLAISSCVLAFAYHYRVGRSGSWMQRFGWPSFWLAASVLAKASGIVFCPLAALAIEFTLWWHRRTHHSVTLRQLGRACFRRWLVQGSLGMLGVYLFVGSDFKPQPGFVTWANKLPDTVTGRNMRWAADHLCIFPNAGEGIVRQVKHNLHGHDGSYLLGTARSRGTFWYYFPVALSIKLSLGLLLLPLLLGVFRWQMLGNWACLLAGLLLVYSLNCKVQIGIRLFLPLIVFACVGLGAASARLLSRYQRKARLRAPSWSRVWKPRLLVGSACLCWLGTTWATLSVWPNGLCFTNQCWGGTESGYLCLSDSNYDWGQGLKELARWQRQQQVPSLDVWYFGTDPTIQQLPMRSVKLHVAPLSEPNDVLKHVQGRHLAVSLTWLYGMCSDTPEHRLANQFLREKVPMARTTTFLIYDLGVR